MNFQWTKEGPICPIVEFHDVRTDRFGADTYLATEERLAAPLVAAGVTAFETLRVTGHPDRLVLLRGYSGMLARRQALTAFHAGPDWERERNGLAGLVRSHEVTLTRAITPPAGIRPRPAGAPLLALVSELRFAEQIGNYHLWLRLLLRKAGMDPFAAFATLEAVNDVPAVPVVRNRTRHIALLASEDGVPDLPAELRGMLRYAPETLRLEPARSLVW